MVKSGPKSKKGAGVRITSPGPAHNLLWGAALLALSGVGGYLWLGQSEEEMQAVATPVIPPPEVTKSEAIPLKALRGLTDTERQVLEKAREYKLAQLNAKIAELNATPLAGNTGTPAGTSVMTSPGGAYPAGSPDDVPAAPGDLKESSSAGGADITVRMIVGQESAWLERDGVRRQVRAGTSLWGVTVASIREGSVCLAGKRPRCLFIDG